MPELGGLLERDMRLIRPPEFDLADVRRRRERRQRNGRIGNIVVALLIATMAIVGLMRAFARVQRNVPAIEPPTGTVVFSRQLADSQVDYVYTAGPDGSHRRLIPSGIDWFSLSPDGTQVLYADLSDTRAIGVLPAVVDLDGSHRRLLRQSLPIQGFWPNAWSPDGSQIVGEGTDLGSGATGLYTARASDGGDLVQITSPPGRRNDHAIGYSPDGSKILFLRPANDVTGNSGGAVQNLFAVNVDGSGPMQLNPPGTVLGPFNSGVAGTPPSPVLDRRIASWSPDGTQVAFAAALATPGQVRGGQVPRGLFVVGDDGSGAHQIVPSAQILDAQWSPDGRWIAFTSADPDRPDVFVVHPDGTGLRRLTSSSHGLGSWGPVWSPDSSAVLFVRNPGLDPFSSDLWFANIDGSGLTQLTNTPAEYFCYGWSPSLRG